MGDFMTVDKVVKSDKADKTPTKRVVRTKKVKALPITDVISDKPAIFICQFCNNKYKKVETLTTHKCKIRDRLNHKNETYFRLGLVSFNIFYEWGFPRGKPKSEMDFIKSGFYDDFLEYGKFMLAIKINDLEHYTKFLLSNNVPIKHWCDDKIYSTYIDRMIKTETPVIAIERAIITMEKMGN